MTQDNGGLAFPAEVVSFALPADMMEKIPLEVMQEITRMTRAHQGMTLRDWYAGMALQGRISSKLYPVDDAPDLAYACYAFADAMLKARGK